MYKNIFLSNNKIGDNMLLSIQNKENLKEIISYLEILNIEYTLDKNNKYTYILTTEFNNLEKLLNNTNKKIIFITYFIETKIIQNKNNYLIKLKNSLKKCYKVITSTEAIKNILKLENIKVLNKPIMYFDIYEKYKIPKRKKKIFIIDLEGKYLDVFKKLKEYYTNYEYLYYTNNFKIKEKNILKFLNTYEYINLIKISYIIINFEKNIDIKYLYPIIMEKKQLIMIESNIYDNYFINYKNIYLFKNRRDFLLKYKKMLEKRIANLTDETYQLIKNNLPKNILKKK